MKDKSNIPEKYYTYRVSVSFNLQFTFNENEVQSAEGEGEMKTILNRQTKLSSIWKRSWKTTYLKIIQSRI